MMTIGCWSFRTQPDVSWSREMSPDRKAPRGGEAAEDRFTCCWQTQPFLPPLGLPGQPGPVEPEPLGLPFGAVPPGPD